MQSTHLHIVLFSLFWLTPNGIGFDGIRADGIAPHTVIFLIFLFFVFYVLTGPRAKEGWKVGAALAALLLLTAKITVGAFYEDTGLLARYYANADWQGQPERSWRYSRLHPDYTRVDPYINFTNKGFALSEQVFPLHFANDSSRFNWYGSDTQVQRRKQFAFSASWDGFIRVGEKMRNLVLLAEGGRGDIEVRGTTLNVNDGRSEPVPLEPGIYAIKVRYAYQGVGDKQLQLAWLNGEQLNPVASGSLSSKQEFSNSFVFYINRSLYLAWLLLILVYLARERTFLGWTSARSKENVILLTLLILFSVLNLVHLIGKGASPGAQILSGGNDWLVYETQARNILMGDWLDERSTNGKPYFVNVLYRYILVVMHWLLGEGVVAIQWFQKTMMFAFLFLFYKAAKQLYHRPVAVLALTQAILFFTLPDYAERLLDTTFAVTFSLSSLYFFIRWRREQCRRFLAWGGVFLALTIAVRANLLPLVAIASIWVWAFSEKVLRDRMTNVAIIVVFALLPLLLIGTRNYVVSGEWVFLPATGAHSFWVGNHPPVFDRSGGYFDASGIPAEGQRFSAALAYILDEPIAFAHRCLEKLMYVLGYDWRVREAAWRIFVPNVLSLLAFLFYRNFGFPKHELFFFYAWIFCVAAPLIVIFPWGYGWRLQAPMIPLTYLLASVTLWQLLANAKNLVSTGRGR